jgi:hypothetical protein
VKLANTLLALSPGQLPLVKLADFGFSKDTGRHSAPASQVGVGWVQGWEKPQTPFITQLWQIAWYTGAFHVMGCTWLLWLCTLVAGRVNTNLQRAHQCDLRKAGT